MALTVIPADRRMVRDASRKNYGQIPEAIPVPNLIQVQLNSFNWFKDPKYDEMRCREQDMTFAAPLRVRVRLVIKESGEVKEQDLFLGDFPMMTEKGTFVINGAERVVVSQLVRSPGVYFTAVDDPTTGRQLYYGKLIPNRGAWLEFATSNKKVISVKVDRKRKLPVTTLLRAIGYSSDEEISALFTSVDIDPEHQYT